MSERNPFNELSHIVIEGGILAVVDILKPEVYRPLSNKELAIVVHRCNCHDELVAAGEEAQIYLNKLKEMEWLHADGIIALEKLEAALAKARKEP